MVTIIASLHEKWWEKMKAGEKLLEIQKDQAEGAGAVPGSGVYNRNGVHIWAVYLPYCVGCEEL